MPVLRIYESSSVGCSSWTIENACPTNNIDSAVSQLGSAWEEAATRKAGYSMARRLKARERVVIIKTTARPTGVEGESRRVDILRAVAIGANNVKALFDPRKDPGQSFRAEFDAPVSANRLSFSIFFGRAPTR